jgi:acetyl-CoA carboxylase biotin carboxyl carrier protein
MMKINKKLIKELVNCLEENKLSELEYSEKDIKIKVARSSSNQGNNIQVLENKIEKKVNEKIDGTEIKSPIIGTAYLAPEPGGKKFVEIGKKIKKGETVMIVEAMKTMNHVPSTKDGIVKKIVVEDGQPVEYGQTLVILE